MNPDAEAGAGSVISSVVIDGAPSDSVRLNVGGLFFQTTLSTLRRHDCMFRAMFSGRMPVRKDKDGFVIIDRSGKHFDTILNFLREDIVPLPDCRHEVAELLQEARYYLIQGLVDQCVSWLHILTRSRNEPIDVPRVPIVMNENGVERIAKSCPDRPLIELLMNRQNNKYSYTHQSDENFLKNQEIFDKLVLRINNRVIFVKNVGTGSSEMCRWRFHSISGKKKTEICCTSIVYATERKQTKVDFPEARIYEETMNILLSNDTTAIQKGSSGTRCAKCTSSASSNSIATATADEQHGEVSHFPQWTDESPAGALPMSTVQNHCTCCGISTSSAPLSGAACTLSASYVRPTSVGAAYSMLFAPIETSASGESASVPSSASSFGGPSTNA